MATTKAKLIVLEGIDGAGKSTQVQFIKNYFVEKNLSYSFFHFPAYGHNEFSKVISKYLQGEFGNIDKVDPIFVATIYAMDRFKFLSTILEKLYYDDVILLDRYVFSNMAYQGAKYKDLSRSSIIKDWIYDFEFNFLKLPYPDLTLFLDVPIYIVEERIKERNGKEERKYLDKKEDIHEKDTEFQSEVRENYLKLLGHKNYKVIKTIVKLEEGKKYHVLSPEELFKSYKSYLDNILFNTPL